MNYKVNKEKCIGCGLCASDCPGGTEIESDGKAEVIDSEKVEKCGGENICPYGAIEKI
jgi:ferredoxin